MQFCVQILISETGMIGYQNLREERGGTVWHRLPGSVAGNGKHIRVIYKII